MPIQDQLAYTQGRKDQEPNKALAREIAESEDQVKLEELIALFDSRPHVGIQKDCALTLAWLAEINPEMIVPHVDYLIGKLSDPVNRVIWGSMIALASIAGHVPEKLFDSLPQILDAMDLGTVVTRDHGFRILVTLYEDKRYQEDVFALILEQISSAPSNQLGQYTEKLMVVLDKSHKLLLISVLEERQQDVVNEHHLKRLNKNLKKLYKL